MVLCCRHAYNLDDHSFQSSLFLEFNKLSLGNMSCGPFFKEHKKKLLCAGAIIIGVAVIILIIILASPSNDGKSKATPAGEPGAESSTPGSSSETRPPKVTPLIMR